MMNREWSHLLHRYGQPVVIHQGETQFPSRAFLQPIREKNQPQPVPSPLGLRPDDRLLYLGTPQHPLSGCWVEWNGVGYAVQSTHPIPVGQQISHIWAILRPLDKEESL